MKDNLKDKEETRREGRDGGRLERRVRERAREIGEEPKEIAKVVMDSLTTAPIKRKAEKKERIGQLEIKIIWKTGFRHF